jgi:multiple sugar transport system substrate-binding protein
MKKLVISMICVGLLAGALFAGAQEEEATGPVTIRFSGWTYDLEKVGENLSKFESWVATEADPAFPGTSVEMEDAGYGEFDTHITTTFAAGGSYDVMYGSDHWLSKWAEAGWVVPLEDHFPELKKYSRDIAPYSVEAMTYKGKLYGLPYYTDVMYFIYNKRMLAEAGIEAPPETWAEVTEQGQKLRQAGITSDPLMVGLKAGSWFDEGFFALIYSEGGTLFDDDLNPVFKTDSGPIYDMIEWVKESIDTTRVIPRKVIEMTAVDVQQAFKKGDTAFAIVPGYMIREFNTPGISEVAGEADVALMPGKSHFTDGYSRMYLMGKSALSNESLKQASWALIEFLGGETTVDGVKAYHIAKRWAIENGLGFSVLSLWNDAEVDRVFSNMGNTEVMKAQKEKAKSKEGISAPWFAEWISLVRTEVQKAILGEEPTSVALDRIKKQWLDLKSE